MTHNIVKGNMNFPKDEDYTDIPCDGEEVWDEGLEGYICSKCQLYTGTK
jgi:hypothetical protein